MLFHERERLPLRTLRSEQLHEQVCKQTHPTARALGCRCRPTVHHSPFSHARTATMYHPHRLRSALPFADRTPSARHTNISLLLAYLRCVRTCCGARDTRVAHSASKPTIAPAERAPATARCERRAPQLPHRAQGLRPSHRIAPWKHDFYFCACPRAAGSANRRRPAACRFHYRAARCHPATPQQANRARRRGGQAYSARARHDLSSRWSGERSRSCSRAASGASCRAAPRAQAPGRRDRTALGRESC